MENEKMDLFQIIRNGKVDLYNAGIENYDINFKNEYGQSLLHEAIAYRQNEIAFDLLNRSIDVNIQDEKGQTALHFISFNPNLTLAEKIIKKGGSLAIKDLYGNTPLWYAVFNARGRYELVDLFVKNGSNPLLKNKVGRSPVDFAMQIKDDTLLSILKL